MRQSIFLTFCAAVLFFAAPSAGQEAIRQEVEIRDSGTDYLQSVRRYPVSTDLTFFDPTGQAPTLDTKLTPERVERSQEGEMALYSRIIWILLSILIIGALVLIVARLGGASVVDLNAQPKDAKSKRRKKGNAPGGIGSALPAELSQILQMTDRRAALLELMRTSLAKAADLHQIRLQRSWTARDALRRIPKDWPLHPPLHTVLVAAERAHFGGRDVSEDDFQAHVQDIAPLFAAAAQT
ncbi:DUF4129 domain-containing protein [Actibacterium sp. 188UL27-1]|uniref:DUF4129 domain-containing protein n=1 Tax=Actibacterium sp. 188UL27-1 TaxID=2786961 RepID=UPI001958CF78|nr:DUF4129 domain-containing protein [Actibacterium sp. 188UL27-1]MBM7066345.1 DUF4129 domain-containing protein [Actibacterium sp. 188UL27-1]